MKKKSNFVPIALAAAGLLMIVSSKKKPSGPAGGLSSLPGPSSKPAFTAASKRTRNILNNNPGNIVISKYTWAGGKIPKERNTDGMFEQFTDMRHGTAAMIQNLQAYFSKGYNTMRKIIMRWSEHPTNSNYIEYVRKRTGLPVDSILKPDKRTIQLLTQSFTEFEGGYKDIISDRAFNEAWQII